MKKLNHVHFIYIYLLSVWLLFSLASCSCKDDPNRPDKNNDTNDIEKLDQAHMLLGSDKTTLLPAEKTFQILLDNQTEIAVNLAEYKLKISLQEEGPTGSTLRYKDVNNQSHDQSIIEQALPHFIKQNTLKKGDKTIILPFDIYNKVGVTRITFTVTLEHMDKRDDVSPINIVWEGLTPITDKMIQEAKANNFEVLANKLIWLKEGEKPIDINNPNFKIDDFRNEAPCQAVKLGSIDIVKVLLERGVQFSTSSLIADPLELAIEENKTEIAKLLIDRLDRRKLNKKNIFDQTLLHIAIQNNNKEIAKLLIEKLDIDKLNQKEKLNGAAPIRIAIEKDNKEVALLLIEKLDQEALGEALDKGVLHKLGRFDNTTLLHLAIEKSNTEIAVALIKKLDASKLNVGKHVDYTAHDPFRGGLVIYELQGRVTPFQLAMKNRNFVVAKALVEKLNVMQLSKQDMDGNTALHLAAGKNQLEIVKKLLDKGLDKTIKNKKGYTSADLTTDSEIRKLLEG